ncbi:hypothetical protein WAF17_18570 [Bernardetia sp. ABR2-2B]|uniref:hypothetical protein n=1 Tax=Bernardetia sp. ABR2-2B TaxID=3127472 RepID=UPI0030CE5CC3
MKILPYDNLTYKTHLSKEEIAKRLNEVTEPKKMIRMTGVFSNKNHKEYEGAVDTNSFKISRIIGYRNSFLPRIEGEIEESKESTLVHIKMRLHTFVLVFMGIWLTIVGLVAIAVLSSLFLSESNIGFGVFIPCFMFLVGLLMPILAFHYEGNKSKEFFENLFEVGKQLSDKKI